MKQIIQIKKLFLTIIFCLIASVAFGADYHVTEDGAGVDYSASTFNSESGDFSDDTFYFSGTFTTRIEVINIYGTSGHPVILDGYAAGSCDPVNDDCASGADLNQGMKIGDSSHTPDNITVQDFSMTRTTANNDPTFFVYPASSGTFDNIIVRRNYVHHSRGAMMYFSQVHTLTINDNKAVIFGQAVNSAQGVNVRGGCQDVIIRSNEFGHDPVGYPSVCDSAEMLEIHASHNILIEYNDIYGAPNQSGIRPKEDSPGGHDLIIRFNKVHDNLGLTGDKDGKGIYAGSAESGPWSDIFIYGNFIYNNLNAGIQVSDYVSDLYIWSNIISDNGRHGITNFKRVAGAASNFYIYNNTLAWNGSRNETNNNRGGIVLATGSGFYVKNNIFWNNRPSGVDSEYNQIYSSVSFTTLEHNTYYHAEGTASFYYNSAYRTFGYMQGLGFENDTPDGIIEDSDFTDPDGADNTYGTHDDDYTLDGSNLNDGEDLGNDSGTGCFAIVVQGTTHTICYNDALGADTDWTGLADTLEANVGGKVVKRDDYKRTTAYWDRGAYVFGSGAEDAEAPTPDPAEWTVEPVGASTVTDTMTATTGSDVSTPIEYQFTHTGSGNADCITDGCADADYGTGGTTGVWQESPTYVDEGLDLNKCYCYTVTMRDALENTGTASAVKAAFTWAATPGASTLGGATDTTIDITEVDENSNLAGTEIAIQCISTSPTDATWLTKWVNDADGTPEAAEQWATFETWDAEVTVGSGAELLDECTTYCFKAKAINADSVETDLGAEVCLETTGDCVTPPTTTGFGITASGVKFD